MGPSIFHHWKLTYKRLHAKAPPYRPCDPNCPIQKVFNIPELTLQILSYLAARDLFILRRVGRRQFRDVIDGEKRLLRMMGLEMEESSHTSLPRLEGREGLGGGLGELDLGPWVVDRVILPGERGADLLMELFLEDAQRWCLWRDVGFRCGRSGKRWMGGSWEGILFTRGRCGLEMRLRADTLLTLGTSYWTRGETGQRIVLGPREATLGRIKAILDGHRDDVLQERDRLLKLNGLDWMRDDRSMMSLRERPSRRRLRL